MREAEVRHGAVGTRRAKRPPKDLVPVATGACEAPRELER